MYQNGAMTPSERSKAAERLASIRVLGPARTCQTVTNPGQFGIGIEFCGQPSVEGKSYCEDCAGRYFVKGAGFRSPPWL